MRKRAWLAGILACLTLIGSAYSQSSDDRNHGTLGVYFDYTRLQSADLNLFGIGGRGGFNVHPHIALEGELAYDFERDLPTFCLAPPFTVDCITSRVHALHGLFGAKVQTTGPVRFFGVAKGGFLHLGTNTSGGIVAFLNGGNSISGGDTHAVFYPGGGVEFGRGRFAIRLEAGDEMFFANGAHHNFKFMGGPQIRF